MKITEYINALNTAFRAGNATEHTYRPALKQYLESLLQNITATNEPKRQKCGAPDYIVTRHTRGNNIDIGYIEAKDIHKNLKEIEKDSQLKRYKESLDNLILTNYLEFRFYQNGEKVAEVKIAEVDDFFRFDGAAIKPLPDNFEKLENLLRDFAGYKGQTIKSAKTLALMMARKAKLMQDVFCKAVTQEKEHVGLKGQLEAFRKILIHDMEAKEFADVYAQTITYGLFTARLHDTRLDDFSRMEALNLIPLSNPFLRKLFQYVAMELDDSVAWIVDALCEVFRSTNIRDILADFGKQTGRNDPIVHFYETFLAEYNPALRKSRGVWYTPEPVVNFIIRAVDDCLKIHFNLPDGIADTSKVEIEVDAQAFEPVRGKGNAGKSKLVKVKKTVHKVQLLDVATGTGTFIAEVIKQIYNGHFQNQQGNWSNYVEENLLPRLHGFEILMASYAMCHMKIDLLLRETGYKPKNEKKPERLGVYLTNSLEEAHPDAETLFASWLSAEANEANLVKRETPVMVAFGNPPYSVSSQNKGDWIQKLIADYKKGLNEKKLNLDDDYIKFIRYAEHFVEKTGYGIVAMITNNSFIDGITHRQMRKHLLETFDTIYIYDLHGSAKKKETAPDGTPDNNVFDIMQGVSISLFIKHKQKKSGHAEVYHAELYGKREYKYEQLWGSGIKQTNFKRLENKEPYYFFVPKNFKISDMYNESISLKDIFSISSTGIETKKDAVCIQFNETEMKAALEDVMTLEEGSFHKKYGFNEKDAWNLKSAKQDLLSKLHYATIITYRPFDFRSTLLTTTSGGFLGRPRYEVMKHMVKNNIAIIAPRIFTGEPSYFITKYTASHKSLSAYDKNTIFPLYIYPTESNLLSLNNNQTRQPNLDTKIVRQIAKALNLPFVPDHEDKKADGKTAFSPLDLLDYIYAVLHSLTYRETYREFLKIDFPRVPYPTNAKIFWSLVALGTELRQLHLLENITNKQFITSYNIPGDNKIEKVQFESGKVYINNTQYFEGVLEAAWNFYIGGYQPAQKWLKDRKTRTLTFEDINHYQKIIVALTETHRIMQEIDKIKIL